MPPMFIRGINSEGVEILTIVCRYEPSTINSAIAEIRLDIRVARIVIDIAV